MKTICIVAFVGLAATSATGEEARQLEAHEHGVGQLDIAIDGAQIAIELHAPGADIVGFEYAATSAEDRAKVADAVATLARPLDLFSLSDAAGCSVVQASASLESEADHDEEHAHSEDEHDEEHAEHGHDDHEDGDEEHAEHDEDEHTDEEHAEHTDEAGHTEFHAEYLLDCADIAAASTIAFKYFDAFPNSVELEVQLITEKGATAFEVERDAPMLDLRSMF
jgi:cobalamin biosynthesis protein CobT